MYLLYLPNVPIIPNYCTYYTYLMYLLYLTIVPIIPNYCTYYAYLIYFLSNLGVIKVVFFRIQKMIQMLVVITIWVGVFKLVNPSTFFIYFSFVRSAINQKWFRRQQYLNWDRWSKKHVCWPLDLRHHGRPLWASVKTTSCSWWAKPLRNF